MGKPGACACRRFGTGSTAAPPLVWANSCTPISSQLEQRRKAAVDSPHSAAALTHGRHFERGATRTAAAVTYPATAADPDPATTFLK